MTDPTQLPDTNIIKTIETGLIGQLKPWLPSDFYISPFPATLKNFDQAMMNAAALVHFAGSRYSRTSEMNHAQQSRELRYAIVLYLSGRFGGTDGYQIIEKVRLALQNVVIPGASPLLLISDQLSEQHADQWVWQVDVACSVPSVAANVSAPRIRTNGPVSGIKHPFNRYKKEEA